MYAKYTTYAVVLSSITRGENDVVAVLYTKDFGLVHARAQSARAEGSRMRFALHQGALATVSLVKGKAGWRLVGARSECLVLSVSDAHVFARVVRLLRRLIPGEDANVYIYDTLRSLIFTFGEAQGERGALELIAVARILYGLGYISAEALSEAPAVFVANTITPEQVLYASEKHFALLGAVNGAIAASQL